MTLLTFAGLIGGTLLAAATRRNNGSWISVLVAFILGFWIVGGITAGTAQSTR